MRVRLPSVALSFKYVTLRFRLPWLVFGRRSKFVKIGMFHELLKPGLRSAFEQAYEYDNKDEMKWDDTL